MSYNRETGMYEGYIYKIINDITPEQVYIGQTTTTPQLRWNGHIFETKHHKSTDKFHNKMNKYGCEHFKMEVIEKHEKPTKEELIDILNKREVYFVSLYDSYKNGLNSTIGGRLCIKTNMRAITRYSLNTEKIADYDSVDILKEEFESVSSIYDCCSGLCKYAYGSIWRYKEDPIDQYELPTNEEIKEAINRYLVRNPIDKYDYRGNKVKTYKNINDAYKSEGATRRAIYKCCTGASVYYNMHIFRFSCDKFDTYRTFRVKPRIVEQYDIQNNFIKAYNSSYDAERETGICSQAITGVCRGMNKTSGGFIWKYLDDMYVRRRNNKASKSV